MAEREDVRGDGAEMGGPGRRGVGFPGEEVEARWLLWCIVIAGFGVGVHCQRVRETEGLVDRRNRDEWTERTDWPTAKQHFSSFSSCQPSLGEEKAKCFSMTRNSLFIPIMSFILDVGF